MPSPHLTAASSVALLLATYLAPDLAAAVQLQGGGRQAGLEAEKVFPAWLAKQIENLDTNSSGTAATSTEAAVAVTIPPLLPDSQKLLDDSIFSQPLFPDALRTTSSPTAESLLSGGTTTQQKNGDGTSAAPTTGAGSASGTGAQTTVVPTATTTPAEVSSTTSGSFVTERIEATTIEPSASTTESQPETTVMVVDTTPTGTVFGSETTVDVSTVAAETVDASQLRTPEKSYEEVPALPCSSPNCEPTAEVHTKIVQTAVGNAAQDLKPHLASSGVVGSFIVPQHEVQVARAAFVASHGNVGDSEELDRKLVQLQVRIFNVSLYACRSLAFPDPNLIVVSMLMFRMT